MNSLDRAQKKKLNLMEQLLNLGEIYVSDFLATGQEPGYKHELKLVMDEKIGAARLETTAPLNTMFGKYWYRSGTNNTMNAALKGLVLSIMPHKKYGNFLDIACNDGTLLSHVPDTFDKKVGVDPCEFSILVKATEHANVIHQSFFNKELFKPNQKFDVVTTVAMFYDIEDYNKFVRDVYDVMQDDGLWVLQLSYTPLMIQQLAFDNILSEHVYYHSLSSMKRVLEPNGFEIVDCTLNDVNGGSFRIFVKKKGQPFATQQYRDVCNFRMNSILAYEEQFNTPEAWAQFNEDIQFLKQRMVSFITQEVAAGKTVMGYGASTKGNTLLQYFGLDNTLITAIAERQECKWGLRTVGTNIPIISEEEMRKAKPDYLLILPWHFIDEFTKRESAYLKAGGHFIVPLPQMNII